MWPRLRRGPRWSPQEMARPRAHLMDGARRAVSARAGRGRPTSWRGLPSGRNHAVVPPAEEAADLEATQVNISPWDAVPRAGDSLLFMITGIRFLAEGALAKETP